MPVLRFNCGEIRPGQTPAPGPGANNNASVTLVPGPDNSNNTVFNNRPEPTSPSNGGGGGGGPTGPGGSGPGGGGAGGPSAPGSPARGGRPPPGAPGAPPPPPTPKPTGGGATTGGGPVGTGPTEETEPEPQRGYKCEVIPEYCPADILANLDISSRRVYRQQKNILGCLDFPNGDCIYSSVDEARNRGNCISVTFTPNPCVVVNKPRVEL